MTDEGQQREALERATASVTQAARAEREHQRQRVLLAAHEHTVARLTRLVAARRQELSEEHADVDRLESFSLTRIATALRGHRETALGRERAEVLAAEYAVADAEQALARARDERTRSAGWLTAHPDPAEALAAALADKALLLSRDPEVGPRLTALARRRGELADEQRELQEASVAGRAAVGTLHEAAELLDSARSWSTYDTFFGGEVISSFIKHQRLDTAAERVRAAGAALTTFTRELADVEVSGPEMAQVSGLLRGMDIWFDNIISDLMVRSRINDSADAVTRALSETQRSLHEVDERLRRATTQAEQVDQDYCRVLGAS